MTTDRQYLLDHRPIVRRTLVKWAIYRPTRRHCPLIFVVILFPLCFSFLIHRSSPSGGLTRHFKSWARWMRALLWLDIAWWPRTVEGTLVESDFPLGHWDTIMKRYGKLETVSSTWLRNSYRNSHLLSEQNITSIFHELVHFEMWKTSILKSNASPCIDFNPQTIVKKVFNS